MEYHKTAFVFNLLLTSTILVPGVARYRSQRGAKSILLGHCEIYLNIQDLTTHVVGVAVFCASFSNWALLVKLSACLLFGCF